MLYGVCYELFLEKRRIFNVNMVFISIVKVIRKILGLQRGLGYLYYFIIQYNFKKRKVFKGYFNVK